MLIMKPVLPYQKNGSYRLYLYLSHYNYVIMGTMASPITSFTNCLLNRLFRCRSKNRSKLRVNGLCGGNSPVAGEFPAQRPVTRKKLPSDYVIIWHVPVCCVRTDTINYKSWLEWLISGKNTSHNFMYDENTNTVCLIASHIFKYMWWLNNSLTPVLFNLISVSENTQKVMIIDIGKTKASSKFIVRWNSYGHCVICI